jgi:TonB family protein
MAEGYRTFGSFILFKEIIADELGHLYRAGELDRGGVGRTVWLRVLDGAAVPTEDVRSALSTARDIGATLRATNIVAEPSYVDVGGVPATAWSYVPGQPLSQLLERVREEGFPVAVDNALLILEKLSLALSAGLAVEVGGVSLTHGFLHPGLVLVSNDGEALVSGFGLGDSLLGVLDDPAAATACRPYLAPEVIESRTPSKRGDVYSLGAILFQLLTGSPLPVDPGQRSEAVADAQLAFEDQAVPDDIKALLRRALSPRAEERYSSASDFKKELDRLLYGGAYSPTTFNLALFMDRLFRADIDVEEKERQEEGGIDPTPYLRPEPEPVEVTEEPARAPAATRGRGLYIGLAAAAVVVVAVVAAVLLLGRGPSAPPVPPTPSPEQVAAEKAAQEEKLKQLAAQMVAEKMAEKEEEIRAELTQGQKRIEELQRQLKDSQQRAGQRELTAEEQKARKALQEQLAAEEAARRKREAELEAERKRAEEEARTRLAAQQAAATATAVAEEAAAAAEPTAAPTRVASASEPTAIPEATRAPAVAASSGTATGAPVVAGKFYDPTEVDSLPAVIKEADVDWPRPATRSRRQGMVIVQALVDADGKVEDVKVLRADDEGFGITEAVLEAVRDYHFRPATKDGVNVKTYATVTRRYKFRDR